MKKIRDSLKEREINLGAVKTWQARLTTYTGLIQFVMIFYLFIVENDWFSWYAWILLITFGVTAIMWYDIIYIFPQQLAYGRIKDPEWNRFVRNQKRIMENQRHIMVKKGIDVSYQEYEER